jgi:hypothetical protein
MVHGLFISLSTFNWRYSPKSLSSAETDLVESTTVQQLWAGVTTKKLILDNFLNSSKLSIVAAKIVRIMSPYTSNASDSHTVLHPLWTNVLNEKEDKYWGITVKIAALSSSCTKLSHIVSQSPRWRQMVQFWPYNIKVRPYNVR